VSSSGRTLSPTVVEAAITAALPGLLDASVVRSTGADVTVTVGTTGTYATLNEALAALSGRRMLYAAEGLNARINILNDGWVMAEQVIVNNGLDLGWVEIVSDQVTVPITRSALVETTNTIPGFTAVGVFRAAFMASNGAVLPRIGCSFTMDASGAVTSSPQSGVLCTNGAKVFVAPGMGFHGCAGLGAHIIQGSTLIGSGSVWSGNGTSGDTYYAGAVRGDWQAFVNLVDANVHDNPGQGVMINGASTASLRNAIIANSGSDGLQTGGASIVHARDAQITGNAGRGVYAGEGSLIRTLNTVITGNGGSGLQIDAGARVNGPSPTISNNGGYGVRVQGRGLFACNTVTIQNNVSGGLYADGGDAWVSGGTISGHPAATDLKVGGGATIRLSGSLTTTSGSTAANNVTDANVSAFNTLTASGSGGIFGRGGNAANRGTTSIAAASTSVTVTHGVDFTPVAGEVWVTPTNNMGAATKFWVTNVTATQFTINVDAAPGVSATFAWAVRRMPL